MSAQEASSTRRKAAAASMRHVAATPATTNSASSSARARARATGASGASGGEVEVALQLPDGSRRRRSFPPATSLWQVLRFWDTSNEGADGAASNGSLTVRTSADNHYEQPACLYLQDRIAGPEALRAATLASLGLTSGRALIRLDCGN